MEYRLLGRTGVKVSSLCLGCMNFGMKTEEDESVRIMNRAFDEGVNFFDTANVYSRGVSETYVGKAIKGKRDRIVLATKVFGTMDDDDPNAGGASRRHIMQQCEASLKRLGTDHIDLYQIHRPSIADMPQDETLKAFDDLIRAGKVRYIGTSTFAAWELIESIWISKEMGLNRYICEQPPYHIMDRRIERELVPMAISYGTALIPWSPLAGGFLTGKYKRDKTLEKKVRYENRDEPQRGLFTEAGFDALEKIEKIAADKGCTVSQFSLAWCMTRPGITSPIIGPRTMEQLEDNLGAADVAITDEDVEKVDDAVAPGRAVSWYYEADFGPAGYSWCG